MSVLHFSFRSDREKGKEINISVPTGQYSYTVKGLKACSSYMIVVGIKHATLKRKDWLYSTTVRIKTPVSEGKN